MNIKLIGKGSFSEVFLIKQNSDTNIFSFDEEVTYIVVKKINLIKLIERYISKNRANKMLFRDKTTSKTISHQITPWQKNYMEKEKEEEDDEVTYYKDKLQKLIQAEVDLLDNIYHYNIIKMFDYSININELKFEYIIKFEYMNCGDLYTILKSNFEHLDKYRNEYNGFNTELTIYIIKNVVEGLKFLHDLNIIHRDIKLHNILISCSNNFSNYKDYKIKISDLGFACIHPEDDNKNLPKYLVKDLKDKWSKICGTPYYMAPEIVKNIGQTMNYSTKSDIWSLGLTLYEMYFNVLPLTNINNIQDIIKFFNNTTVQDCIDFKIQNIKGFNSCIKEILTNSLKVDEKSRCNIDDLQEILNSEKKEEYSENQLYNMVISTDNNWKINDFLKQSFMEIDKEFIEMESWVKL